MSIIRHRATPGAVHGAVLVRGALVRIVALSCAVAAAAAIAVPVFAQTGRATVGNIRIGDDSGQAIWQEAAGPGEKLFKAPAGTKQFKVWFDYDGTAARRAVIKVMAPQGVIVGFEEIQLSTPGLNSIDFSFDEPLADAEYLVNAYVEVDGRESPADGLTLLVGDAVEIPASNEVQQPVDDGPSIPDPQGEVVNPPTGGVNDVAAPRAGEPSQLLLVGSGLGVIVLLAIVVWAGMSALKQR